MKKIHKKRKRRKKNKKKIDTWKLWNKKTRELRKKQTKLNRKYIKHVNNKLKRLDKKLINLSSVKLTNDIKIKITTLGHHKVFPDILKSKKNEINDKIRQLKYDLIAKINEKYPHKFTITPQYFKYKPKVRVNPISIYKNNFVIVRIEYKSNESISSYWKYKKLDLKDGLYGELVKLFLLNPIRLKESLLKHELNCIGKYPTFIWRENKEYVDFDEFVKEIKYNFTNNSKLVAIGKIRITDLYRLNKTCKINYVKQVTLPKGTILGFFDMSIYGGSLLNMRLKRDMVINVSKKGNWKLELDYDNPIHKMYRISITKMPFLKIK